MADCVQIMRENSQAFFYNLKTTDLIVKNMTRGFLLENGGSILCLETPDVDVTKVLLAQVLMNFKKDTIFKDNNLNEILFTDFSSFTTMTSGQNEDFLKNFPDLLVCILDNEQEELSKQSHIMESWINIIKLNSKKIILIVKNPKHVEKFMMNNEMTNNFKMKLDKLWKQNEITSNNEAICEVGNNLVHIESTSARALDECTDGNLKEEESSGKSSSYYGEATTKEEDLKNLLQSLGVKEVDAVNEDGDTQLHLAARDGKTEIVKSLLVHGAKKDVPNNRGFTALHFAAKKGHSAIVQVLLEHGFNVNATANNYYYWTPLHYACCYHDDAHLIEILLKFVAKIERKDCLGRTALHLASCYDRSAVVNSLLKNGANINAQNNYGNTPLHFATSNNQQEVVLILLQHGASLDIKNKQQENALELAISCPWDRTKIIEILENHK